MLLVSYNQDGDPARRLGIQSGDTIIDVAELVSGAGSAVPGLGQAPASVLDLIQAGPDALAALERLLTLSVPETAQRPWPR
ncbi:hypothetical protein ACFQ0G_00515 [Streptomyces chiangmaiensis]